MNMSFAVLESIWLKIPLGIAAINMEGHVQAVNPAFEKQIGIDQSEVVAMSEAAFDALLRKQFSGINKHKYHRIEVKEDDLRAIYYCENTNQQNFSKADFPEEPIRESLSSIYGFTELLLTQHYDEQTRLRLTNTLLEQIEILTNFVSEKLAHS